MVIKENSGEVGEDLGNIQTGLSPIIKWLAEKLGKSSCTVSKWCSNSNQPDLQTLEKIAQLLYVDKRDLLTPTKNN